MNQAATRDDDRSEETLERHRRLRHLYLVLPAILGLVLGILRRDLAQVLFGTAERNFYLGFLVFGLISYALYGLTAAAVIMHYLNTGFMRSAASQTSTSHDGTLLRSLRAEIISERMRLDECFEALSARPSETSVGPLTEEEKQGLVLSLIHI